MNELEPIARAIAAQHSLDPDLVCGIITQESSWNPYALRSESKSGFAARYGAEYHKIVIATASKYDDKWIQFEDIFYASYGLMQAMYPVVIEAAPELAAALQYPTQLCKAEIGIEAGCRILLRKLHAAKNDARQALLYWNGGGDPAYPDKVFAHMNRAKADAAKA
jgi:soluble lytic murein transglycosylase-like protein